MIKMVFKKGYKETIETKIKRGKAISKGKKGYKHSEKTKKKIKETKKESYKSGKTKLSSSCFKKGELCGEKSYNWKGGITTLVRAIRNCDKYKAWRLEVYERDNFTCQRCDTIGGKLHAHHIKSFSSILEENNIKTFNEAKLCEELWFVFNGMTLCKKCHKLWHKENKTLRKQQ